MSTSSHNIPTRVLLIDHFQINKHVFDNIKQSVWMLFDLDKL